MKEIIKELSGWLLYIVLIIALTWTVVVKLFCNTCG